jgi:hypothetical protein
VPATRAPGPSAVPRKVTDRLAENFGLDGDFLRAVVKSTISIAKRSGDVSDVELVGFMVACDQYGLNPFVNQVYAFIGRDKKVHPLVGVDGWLSIMHRQPTFGGLKFEYDFPGGDKSKQPISCTAIMARTDLPEPIIIEEFTDECKRGTEPWNKMPRRMIRNAAIKQCVRIGFGLASVYDVDDAKDIDPQGVMVDFTAAKDAKVVDVQPIDTEQKLEPVDVEFKPQEGTETPTAEPLDPKTADEVCGEMAKDDEIAAREAERWFEKYPPDTGLECPPDLKTATGTYEASGPGAGVEKDGWPVCAGCGGRRGDHVIVEDDIPHGDQNGENQPKPQDEFDHAEAEAAREKAITDCKKLEIGCKDRDGVFALRKSLKKKHDDLQFTFQTPAKLPGPVLFEYLEGLRMIADADAKRAAGQDPGELPF